MSPSDKPSKTKEEYHRELKEWEELWERIKKLPQTEKTIESRNKIETNIVRILDAIVELNKTEKKQAQQQKEGIDFNSPKQQYLFEKMGIRLKVSKTPILNTHPQQNGNLEKESETQLNQTPTNKEASPLNIQNGFIHRLKGVISKRVFIISMCISLCMAVLLAVNIYSKNKSSNNWSINYALEYSTYRENEERIKKLFEFLTREEYKVPQEFDDFKKSIYDKNGSDALYECLIKDGYTLPAKDVFYFIQTEHYRIRLYDFLKENKLVDDAEDVFLLQINKENQQYRKEIYELLKRNVEDLKVSYEDFEERLDFIERNRLATNESWPAESFKPKGFDYSIIWLAIIIFIVGTLLLAILWVLNKLLIRTVKWSIKSYKTSKTFRLRTIISLVGITAIMSLTNPTIKDFKESGHDHVIHLSEYYNNEDDEVPSRSFVYRKSNFLFFSVYVCSKEKYNGESRRYLGILKNFYELD